VVISRFWGKQITCLPRFHVVREELWVARVRAQRFDSALFVCGFLHTLSLSFRLQAAGFLVPGTRYYMPHNKLNKLCTLVLAHT